MANVETIEIEDLRGKFFSLMEEICIPDMDEKALEEYQQRHADDESQDQEAA